MRFWELRAPHDGPFSSYIPFCANDGSNKTESNDCKISPRRWPALPLPGEGGCCMARLHVSTSCSPAVKLQNQHTVAKAMKLFTAEAH